MRRGVAREKRGGPMIIFRFLQWMSGAISQWDGEHWRGCRFGDKEENDKFLVPDNKAIPFLVPSKWDIPVSSFLQALVAQKIYLWLAWQQGDHGYGAPHFPSYWVKTQVRFPFMQASGWMNCCLMYKEVYRLSGVGVQVEGPSCQPPILRGSGTHSGQALPSKCHAETDRNTQPMAKATQRPMLIHQDERARPLPTVHRERTLGCQRIQ